MTVKIELTDWQAARLLQLVKDGEDILSQQGRQQRGIDGYTFDDLNQLKRGLRQTDEKCSIPGHKIKIIHT